MLAVVLVVLQHLLFLLVALEAAAMEHKLEL
jgi:hypothetical protein